MTATAATEATKLFISFSSVLKAVYKGELTADDFKDSLFYLSCTREFALSCTLEKVQSMWNDFELDAPRVSAAYQLVCAAISAAEQGDRVAWPTSFGNTYRELNELLVANYLPRVEPRSIYFGTDHLNEAIQAQGLSLRVFGKI